MELNILSKIILVELESTIDVMYMSVRTVKWMRKYGPKDFRLMNNIEKW